MFDPIAPRAHRLARRVKSWHVLQGDRLSLGHCQQIVAALHGYTSWAHLKIGARVVGEPVGDALDVGGLKRFGYTSEAAQNLLAYLAAHALSAAASDESAPAPDAHP